MGLIQKFGGAYQGRALLILAVCILSIHGAAAQEIVAPSSAGLASVRLEAEQQRKEGDIYFADGKVEIQYRNYRLRADHVQYNSKTYVAAASGHVQLDVDTQHLSADTADFNVKTGEGRFVHVRG